MSNIVSTIDIKDAYFDSKLIASIKDTGFAIIDLNSAEFNSMYKELEDKWLNSFFLARPEFKNSFHFERNGQEGYFSFKSETAKGYNKADLKEFYQMYNTDVFNTLYMKNWLVDKVGKRVIAALSGDLDINLWSMVDGSKQTMLRILHYPPIISFHSGEERASAHEDINFITLLPASSVSGLQIQLPNGNWGEVEAKEGQIIVNVGDMLQMLSDGRYKSTSHRVTNNAANNSRLSFPLFIHPHSNTNLGPMTAAEFLEQRLQEIGLKG